MIFFVTIFVVLLFCLCKGIDKELEEMDKMLNDDSVWGSSVKPKPQKNNEDIEK